MAIDDDIAFLERVPTLGLLGRPALRILAIGAETRHLVGGEVLFNAGDEAEGGFVVQAGRFHLHHRRTARTSPWVRARFWERSRCSPRPGVRRPPKRSSPRPC